MVSSLSESARLASKREPSAGNPRDDKVIVVPISVQLHARIEKMVAAGKAANVRAFVETAIIRQDILYHLGAEAPPAYVTGKKPKRWLYALAGAALALALSSPLFYLHAMPFNLRSVLFLLSIGALTGAVAGIMSDHDN
jgi:hypothetical protein